MSKVLFKKVLAEDLFSSLSSESEKTPDKEFFKNKNSSLEKMINAFYNIERNNYIHIELLINKINDSINFEYTSSDIKQLSIYLKNNDNYYNFEFFYGIFLSMLINKSNEFQFEINTHGLNPPPERLGYLNKKNIIINGNAGGFLGYDMSGGIIILYGNAYHCVGYGATGGRIYLNGEYETISLTCDAEIFHKGKIINKP